MTFVSDTRETALAVARMPRHPDPEGGIRSSLTLGNCDGSLECQTEYGCQCPTRCHRCRTVLVGGHKQWVIGMKDGFQVHVDLCAECAFLTRCETEWEKS